MYSFSCIFFLTQLHKKRVDMHYFMNFTLKYLNLQSRTFQIGSSLSVTLTTNCLVENEIKIDVKKTSWHHAWETFYIHHVRWHFLAYPTGISVNPTGARKCHLAAGCMTTLVQDVRMTFLLHFWCLDFIFPPNVAMPTYWRGAEPNIPWSKNVVILA